MPIKIKLDTKSALKSVEACQKAMKSKDFNNPTVMGENGKSQVYTFIFALRDSVNSVRGEKSSLKVPLNQEKFQASVQKLQGSQSFKAFLQKQGDANMTKLLSKGHGGEADDAFRDYVMESDKLPADVPERWMPTAKDRIEQQQKKLENLHPSSEEAVAAYAEIFRSRRAVEAVRNKPGTLEAKISGSSYAALPDLSSSETFKDFVRDKGSRLKKTAVTGHGGAAEEMFKEHVLQCDRLPGDVPAWYMPDALKRTEALQEKLRSTTEPQRQSALFSELMATREAVGAERGNKKSLEKSIDHAALEEARKTWDSCETFQNFLKENEEEAREAVLKGHGGALGDKFSEYVRDLDHIPEDVPEGSMPTAYDHIEALQKKYKGIGYFDSTDERKLTLAAEIMASREAVQAERGKGDSLKKPIKPEELKTAYKKWSACKAFAEFVKNENQKVYDGAVAGHGGALGDKFKEYLVNRDELEADIPADYMPTARVRAEALQKKLRESTAGPSENRKLYAELMATRGSVGAVRGKKGSLDVQLEPEALEKQRTELMNSEAFQLFLADSSQSAAIRKAALDGHGGALEDAFKSYVGSLNRIPANTPERYMPKALERTELLQKKIEAGAFESEADRASVYVELVATREAVGAIRGKKDSLDKPIDPAALQKAREKWDACNSFKNFVNAQANPNYGKFQKAALAGHGGALLDLFKEEIKRAEFLPEDLPDEVIPNADERIEALQKELKENDGLFTEDKTSIFAQILAARSNVGAIRGKGDSLEKRLDPAKVNEEADKLSETEAFKSFVEDNEEKLDKLVQKGHGGELEDEFKKYVRSMEKLPDDVPKAYMPTAMTRVEGLQDKIKSAEFRDMTLDEKTGYYAELMAARRAVGAERNKKETLNVNVDPKKAADVSKKLMECETFQNFIKNDPAAARKAALDGHGGALEDSFKKYVLKLPKIPGDVPKEYMPNAKERTEALQDKIKAKDFSKMGPANKVSVYRELIATRTAVNSLRGDKKSLDTTVDPEKLDQARQQLANCRAVTDFLENTDEKTLMDAATNGHGGALEDKLKEHIMKKSVEEGAIPDGLPDRLKPSAADMQEQLRLQLGNDARNDSLQFADLNKQSYMKRIACSMYLFKLQKESQKTGVSPVLDKAVMDRNVNKLMNSQAFQSMFQNPGSARNLAAKVASKRMSEVFTSFAEHRGQFELEGHQPVVQHQPIQNQRQNQPNQNQPNQNQLNQNNPNADQNRQPLQNDPNANLDVPQL